ncbi:hypothetical protein BH11CYA1_BH11CYA1_13160 [soil metagenome]
MNKKNKNKELQLSGQHFQVKSKRNQGKLVRPDGTTEPTPMAALAVAGLGCYFIALGLGYLPIPPGALHGPAWTLTAIGSALFFAGISIELQCLGLVQTWLYKIVLVAIFVAMLSPFAWLVFGDSHLNLFFRIGFSSPFVIIFILLLPFGKIKIIPNPQGKPMIELVKDRLAEPSALQQRKLKIEEEKSKKKNGNNEI